MKRIFLALGIAGLIITSCGERQQSTPGDEYGSPRTVDPGIPAGDDTVVYEHEHGVDTVTDPGFSQRGTQEDAGMEEGQQQEESAGAQGEQQNPGVEEGQQDGSGDNAQQQDNQQNSGGAEGEEQDSGMEGQQQQGDASEGGQDDVTLGEANAEPNTEEGHRGLGAVATEGATREPGRVQRRHGYGRTGATGPLPERVEPATTPGSKEEQDFARDRTGAADPEVEGPGPDADAGVQD